MVTKKMCDTNKNMTEIGVIIKGVYYIRTKEHFFPSKLGQNFTFLWGGAIITKETRKEIKPRYASYVTSTPMMCLT
jgi:hypothetical protein